MNEKKRYKVNPEHQNVRDGEEDGCGGVKRYGTDGICRGVRSGEW